MIIPGSPSPLPLPVNITGLTTSMQSPTTSQAHLVRLLPEINNRNSTIIGQSNSSSQPTFQASLQQVIMPTTIHAGAGASITGKSARTASNSKNKKSSTARSQSKR